jgi:hypothetical protein
MDSFRRVLDELGLCRFLLRSNRVWGSKGGLVDQSTTRTQAFSLAGDSRQVLDV